MSSINSIFPKPLGNDINEVAEAIAIVIDGDKAPKAITSGQYLFIKNHSTLITGGYHASANIASGADITSSNVVSDTDGIVNALNGNINNKTLTQTGLTIDSTFTESVGGYCRIGQFVMLQIRLNKASSYSFVAGSTIISGLPPALDTPVYMTPSANISNGELYIDTNGNLKNQNAISADRTMFVSGMYLAST